MVLQEEKPANITDAMRRSWKNFLRPNPNKKGQSIIIPLLKKRLPSPITRYKRSSFQTGFNPKGRAKNSVIAYFNFSLYNLFILKTVGVRQLAEEVLPREKDFIYRLSV